MFFFFQNKSKELQKSVHSDKLLLTKSSLEIPLLPETQEDKNLAALLALKPSRTINEKQNEIRKEIINSPALPSSSGLITSFGGLKKEKLLQNKSLTRSSLGISLNIQKNSNNTSPGSQNKSELELSASENCPLNDSENDSKNRKRKNSVENASSKKSLLVLCNYDSTSSSDDSQ